MEDKQGNLWAGSYKRGLFKFTKQGRVINYRQGLLANGVLDLAQGQKGDIWIANNKGFSKITNQNIVFYSQKEGLSGQVISSVFEDSQGYLWLGTYYSGLIGFDGQKFTYYTKRQGLLDDNIKSILESSLGDIWVATTNGLNCIQKQRERVNILPYHYQSNGNLLEFRLKSAIASKQGVLYWGTDRHLVSLDIGTHHPKFSPIDVVIQQVKVNGKAYDYNQLPDSLQATVKYDSISQFYQVPLGLSLPYDFNSLTFHFLGIKGLTNNSMVLFSYRIKELNQTWSEPSQVPLASFQSLPYGKFTLEVKALNNAKQWGNILSYEFNIRPPYWATWWCRLLGICSVAIILIGLHQWRLLTIRRKRQQLEYILATKTVDLLKANQQLLSLNNELSQSKNDVIALKEKERSILTKTLKSRERRFFTAIKVFEEKHKALRDLNTRLSKITQIVRNPHLLQIKDDFNNLLRSIANLDILAESLESKYPQILAEINTLFPDLSQNEAKHCLLVRLNCSAKEAAQLLGVSVNATHMARRRLKKKIGLNEEESLRKYLLKTLI